MLHTGEDGKIPRAAGLPAVTSCSCRCSRHSARRRFAATPPIAHENPFRQEIILASGGGAAALQWRWKARSSTFQEHAREGRRRTSAGGVSCQPLPTMDKLNVRWTKIESPTPIRYRPLASDSCVSCVGV